MSSRGKLFNMRGLYDLPGSDAVFLDAMRENIAYHSARCPEYRLILRHRGFDLSELRNLDALARILPLPTMFLKAHTLFSVPEEKLLFKANSSGTSGKASQMGLDFDTARLALKMVLKTFSYYKLISLRLTNYIVLGFEPSKRNKMGAAQTAFGATLLAPALHRAYALRDTGDAYEANIQGLVEALLRYERAGHPVRLFGFPAYLLFLLEALDEAGVSLKLHPKSMIMTAGGWKQFFSQKADRNELYERARKTLGITEKNCHDFYGAVEHPVLYCDCRNHHFHVPKYSRIIIRDPKTLEPLPFGKPGLINLLTPLMGSMPFMSVMTDDLAVLHEGGSCGCGTPSPWFEILGRVGLESLKTCAAKASDMVGEIMKEVRL